MIYFTGDTHREIDVHKLNTTNWPEQMNLTKDDYLIILGDFGCVWDGGKSDLWWQKWHNDKPYTTLFVPGNHENYDLLCQYPAEEWHGGIVRRIQPSVLMLERGYIFEIGGKTIFAMGGAQSHDKEYRVMGETMWADEMPNDGEYEVALGNLELCGNKVDLILTHCAPYKIEDKIFSRSIAPQSDALTRFLQSVDDDTEYDLWLFGHYHIDTMIDEKHICLYDCVASLDEIVARRDELLQNEQFSEQHQDSSKQYQMTIHMEE